MLELNAQEEVEILMKILENQQGVLLKKLLELKNTSQDTAEMKKKLTVQYLTLAETSDKNNVYTVRSNKLKDEEMKIRLKIDSAQAEKGRVTASISKVCHCTQKTQFCSNCLILISIISRIRTSK